MKFLSSFLFFFVLSCLFNLSIFLGPYQLVRTNDSYMSFMTKRQVASDQVFQYGISGWDPSALCGNNFLAAYLHTPIQPAMFLAHLFPLWFVNGLVQILFTFFAGFGMFLYFNRILKCSAFSSFIGGIFFVGLTVEYQQDRSLVFLFPMFLYLFYSWNCFTWIRKIGYILFFYFCLTTSSAQFSVPFFPLLHVLDFFFISKPEKLTRLSFFKRFFFLWAIYGFIHVPTLYTFLTEGFISHRALASEPAFIPNLNALFRLLSQSFFKNFFGAFIPFSTALITLFFLRYSRIRFCWFMIFLLILAKWTLDTVPFQLEMGAWRPFIITIYQAMEIQRFFELWIPFLYCVLATHGVFFLEKMKKDELLPKLTFNSKKIVVIVFPFILIGLLVGSFIYRVYFPHKRIPIILFGFFFFSFLTCLIPYFYFMYSKWFKSRLFFFGLAAIMILFLISSKMEHAFFHSRIHFNFLLSESDIIKNIRSQQKSEIIPERVALFKSIHNFHHYAIYLNYHGLHTIDGLYSLYSVRYATLFKTLGKPYEKSGFSYSTELHTYFPDNTYYTSSHFTQKSFNENLLALMNVKYIFSPLPIERPDQFGLSLYYDPKVSNHFELNNCSQIYKQHIQNILQEMSLTRWLSSISHLKEAYMQCRSYYWVYTLNQTIPRVFITPQVELVNDQKFLLQMLSKRNSKELMQSSLFLKKDIEDASLPTSEKSFQWSVEPTTYTPDYIKIKGFSEKQGILVLTDTFHPKWNVYVNGIKSKIFPAYYTFRGVIIPEGHFSVEFKYEDSILSVMYVIMWMGVLGLIMMIILNRRSSLSDHAGE